MEQPLDEYLRILDAQQGNELRMEAGEPIRLLTDMGPVNLTNQPITIQQLGAIVNAALSEELRRALATQHKIEFDYECAGIGRFNGIIVRDARGVIAGFKPDRAANKESARIAEATARRAARPTNLLHAIDAFFHEMVVAGASDLHLCSEVPIQIRRDGHIEQLDPTADPLSAEDIRHLVWDIMPEKNRDEFTRRHDTDFAYEIPGLARFRANIFMDRKGIGAVFRLIPYEVRTAESLGLSDSILGLCRLSKGLVLVTGPTGSGKSTTLCALVDYINRTRSEHIITIEDPIEFVHENKGCLINQREVHNHTASFKDALRAALREDPDIVLVGEMRDLETISIAIETAETGHLVFGTLHTTTAASTVDRIIDQFPPDRQEQIRVMLADSLKGVIAQTLLKKKGGGRVAALEVLIVNSGVSNLIREGKTFQIPSIMQTQKGAGMVMLNDALFEHVKSGAVDPDEAYSKALDKSGFEGMLRRINMVPSALAKSAE